MKKNLGGIVLVVTAVAAMSYGGVLMASSGQPQVAPTPTAQVDTPATPAQSGIQTLEITAKGGYSPVSSELKAEAPALLRVITNSTFDCSSSLTIPVLDYRTHLPMTGTTEISIPPQPVGTTLTGLCGIPSAQMRLKEPQSLILHPR